MRNHINVHRKYSFTPVKSAGRAEGATATRQLRDPDARDDDGVPTTPPPSALLPEELPGLAPATWSGAATDGRLPGRSAERGR